MPTNIEKFIQDRKDYTQNNKSFVNTLRWFLFFPIGLFLALLTYIAMYHFVGTLMCNDIISFTVFFISTLLIAPKHRIPVFIFDIIFLIILLVVIAITSTGFFLGNIAEIIMLSLLALMVIFKAEKLARIVGFIFAFSGGIISIVGIITILTLINKLFPNEVRKSREYFTKGHSSDSDKDDGKWENIPLKLYIEPLKYSKELSEKYRKMVIEAFNEWTFATEGRITYEVVDNYVDADIDVQWKVMKDRQYGYCFYEYDKKGKLTNVEINVKIDKKEIQLLKTEEDMYSDILYLVGRSLCIPKSVNPDDVMYLPKQKLITKLSNNDKQILLNIYNKA